MIQEAWQARSRSRPESHSFGHHLYSSSFLPEISFKRSPETERPAVHVSLEYFASVGCLQRAGGNCTQLQFNPLN